MKCSKCGVELESTRAAQLHWVEAHPGERSKSKRATGRPPGRPRKVEREDESDRIVHELREKHRGEPRKTMDELGIRLDDVSRETPPDLGPDAVEPAVPARAGWLSRLWSGRSQHPGSDPAPARPPRRVSGRRTSAEPILRGGWGLLGAGLIRTGVDVPVGRCLQYQAPVAGDVLDKFLAGGWFDRVALQPLASRSDELEVVAALAGLPLAIAAYERATDEIRAVLEPIIVELVRLHITAMAPVLAKRRKREAELAKTVEDMKAAGEIDAELGDVDDVVAAIVNAMFAPAPSPPPAPEPEPAAV